MYPVDQNTRMHDTLFASTEGRMLGFGLALTSLMLLAFGNGWHLFPGCLRKFAVLSQNLWRWRVRGRAFKWVASGEF